jgi:hypothetical protein
VVWVKTVLLERPIVQRDLQLRLRVLTVKGDTDMHLDLDTAQRDWAEGLEVAKSLGDKQWEARASGELGIDFQQGDTAEFNGAWFPKNSKSKKLS